MSIYEIDGISLACSSSVFSDTPDAIKELTDANLKALNLPIIHAGDVGSNASLTYSIDKNGNLIMTEMDDDGVVVSKQID